MSHSEQNNQLLDSCYQLLLDSIKQISVEILDDIDTELEKNIAKSSSNQANIAACEDANVFDNNKTLISSAFCECIQNGFVAFKDNSLFTQIKRK